MSKLATPKPRPTILVETLPVGELHLDPANARRHPERNLDAIKASLARFGQQSPIVVDSNHVVRKGNGTLQAAIELGWETIEAVVTPLEGTEATAYAISDNRTAELAEWDDTALAEILRALQSEDFDLAAVGYRDDEVDALVEGLAREAVLPADADGKEYDESVAEEVEYHECPACRHRWPK
jgi:ParB-like chromosome segregation protein Spo0J